MGENVKLSEASLSYINHLDMMPLLQKIVYAGGDMRDVWIGPHRPATTSRDEGLQAYARGNAIHYLYYLSFVEDFMQPDGLVMDIGSGCGARTAMLGRYASKVIGVEAIEEVVDFARKYNNKANVAYIHATFPCQSILPGVYDYIFMIEVIEHVPHNKQTWFIDSAMSYLSPGGLLFMTTPANEEDCTAPHIGVWTAAHFPKILAHLSRRIVHLSHLDRDAAWENGDPRCNRANGSHHRIVVQKEPS